MVKMFRGLGSNSDKKTHDLKKKEQTPPIHKKMQKDSSSFLGERHTGQTEVKKRHYHEITVEEIEEDAILECDEPSLTIQSKSLEVSPSVPAGVLVSGPEERFLHNGQYHIFPKWFEMSNGEVYEATRTCYSGAKGVVRVYFCKSQTNKRMVVKVFTSSSDEFFIEREGSRRTLGVAEFMQSWTFPDAGFIFAEFVGITLREMCASGYDKVSALRDVSRMVRLLNANLAARGAVYLDCTSLNIAYDRQRAQWKMIDLGGLYLRNFWSDVVTPSFVPPFLWRRNRQQKDGETFEIRGQSSTLEELRLVSVYGVLATFGAIALESSGVRASSDVYMLHSTFMRSKLRRSNDDSKPIFERYLKLLRGDTTRVFGHFKERNGDLKSDANDVVDFKSEPSDVKASNELADILCKYLPYFLDENATLKDMNFAFDEICNL